MYRQKMSNKKSIRRNRVIIICAVVVVVLALLSLVLSHIDFLSVDEGKRPAFCISTTHFKDGGTVEWWGLGYRLTAKHSLAERNGVEGYTVGPILEYWVAVWPFTNKQHTWFEPQTEQETSNKEIQLTN